MKGMGMIASSDIAGWHRREWVQPGLGAKVCRRGESCGGEHTKVFPFAIGVDVRHPFPCLRVPGYARVPAGVVRANSAVLLLLCVGCWTQVRYVIRVFDTVLVVYLICRPFTMDVKPRKPMLVMVHTVDSDPSVPTVDSPSTTAARGCAPFCHQPGEDASLWVVVKKFAQALRGKIGLSHEALQLRIGQMPACVCALGGLRYSNGVETQP